MWGGGLGDMDHQQKITPKKKGEKKEKGRKKGEIWNYLCQNISQNLIFGVKKLYSLTSLAHNFLEIWARTPCLATQNVWLITTLSIYITMNFTILSMSLPLPDLPCSADRCWINTEWKQHKLIWTSYSFNKYHCDIMRRDMWRYALEKSAATLCVGYDIMRWMVNA